MAAGRGVSSPASSGEVRELGEAKRAEIVATYDYRDIRGQLIYQVLRMKPKTFRQRRPHPKREGQWVWSMKAHPESGLREQPTVLYRIPELAAALTAEDPIFLCEGERDVEALMAADQVATCNTGGAGKWRSELAAPFSGFRGTVRIIQDRDPPGEDHARAIFESLSGVLHQDATLMIVEAASGKDAADHLGLGKTVADFVQVWPLPENLLEVDPKRFKQIMLEKALESPRTVLDYTSHEAYKHRQRPIFYGGLANLEPPLIWQGCVVVSGAPSAGKSYLSIATGVDAAASGWDVFYLSCEMSQETIRDRAARAVASTGVEGRDIIQDRTARSAIAERARQVRLPDRFMIVDVGIGVTIQAIIEFLAGYVTERPSLVILDSISSLVDNMAVDSGDSFGMASLREVTRWAVGVSKLSFGQIAFLILSELNKEGRAKGRALDHRCDFALAMESSDEEDHARVKTIRTTKNWHGPTGRIGDFALYWEVARLVRIGEDGDW